MRTRLKRFIGMKCIYCEGIVIHAGFKTVVFTELVCANGHKYCIKTDGE